MSSKNKIIILFVLGQGRSGSTVLNLLLGKSQKVLAIGELVENKSDLLKRIDTVPCSCFSEENQSCGFWNEIKNNLKKSDDEFVHKYIFEYAKKNNYKIIFDTSKFFFKLKLWQNFISNRDDAELNVIHLYRDFRGVAHSEFKRNKKVIQIPKTILSSLYYFLKEIYEKSKLKEPIFNMFYENLIFNPNLSISKLEKFLGQDFKLIKPSNLLSSDAHELSQSSLKIKNKGSLFYDFSWKSNFWINFCAYIMLPILIFYKTFYKTQSNN